MGGGEVCLVLAQNLKVLVNHSHTSKIIFMCLQSVAAVAHVQQLTAVSCCGGGSIACKARQPTHMWRDKQADIIAQHPTNYLTNTCSCKTFMGLDEQTTFSRTYVYTQTSYCPGMRFCKHTMHCVQLFQLLYICHIFQPRSERM